METTNRPIKNIFCHFWKYFHEDKRYLFFIFFAISLWTYTVFSSNKLLADEKFHYVQIELLCHGKFEMVEKLTTIPGYHAIVASIVDLTGEISARMARIISFVLSLLIIPVFYLVAKKLRTQNPLLKTIQFMFLPISFIYFPLIYTDMLSALFVLLAFYLVLIKKYPIAAIISILSLTIRQNNIIWLLFLWTYAYLDQYGLRFSLKIIPEYLKSTALFFVGPVLFIIFFILNKGILIGDKNAHPLGLYLGNIYFFIAIFFLLFFPLLLSKMLLFIKKRSFRIKTKTIFILLLGIAIASSFYFLPPKMHSYNFYQPYLRNMALILAYNKYIWLYSIAIFMGIITLFNIKFNQKHNYALYPFIFLLLVPSWMIEQRYLIIPFLFILLFRKEAGEKTEWIITAYFAFMCLLLTFMITSTKMFF